VALLLFLVISLTIAKFAWRIAGSVIRAGGPLPTGGRKWSYPCK